MSTTIFPICFLTAFLLFCGCSTTRYFEGENLSSASFDLLKNKESDVRLLDSSKVSGDLSGADSVSIYITNSTGVHAVSIREIRSITQNLSRWKGAAQGFGLGFMSGLAMGVLITGVSDPCSDKREDSGWAGDFCPFMRPYYWIAGALIGGIAGGAVGATTGAVVGDRDVYKFKQAPKKIERSLNSPNRDPI